MRNRNIIRLFGLMIPLALAAGCAEHERRTEAGFTAGQFTPLPATSDRADTRVYAGLNTEGYAPPPGAPAGDWKLAEEIRDLLTRDRDLAPENMGAVVKSGQVTLRGYVPTSNTHQRLVDAISHLPGVTKVNDELEVKNTVPGWHQPDRSY